MTQRYISIRTTDFSWNVFQYFGYLANWNEKSFFTVQHNLQCD